MNTILHPIYVPGWPELQAEHPTRALTLQALTNLELRYHLGERKTRPTRKQILAEANRLGAGLSSRSGQTVQRHLEALEEAGHVLKSEAGKSPWSSRYLCLHLSSTDKQKPAADKEA